MSFLQTKVIHPSTKKYIPIKEYFQVKQMDYITLKVLEQPEPKPRNPDAEESKREYDILINVLETNFTGLITVKNSGRGGLSYVFEAIQKAFANKELLVKLEVVWRSSGNYYDYKATTIDNQNPEVTIEEPEQPIEQQEEEIDTMKLTPEIFSRLSLEKKKEVVIRFGEYVKNLKVTNPNGNIEQPFSNLKIDIGNDGKYGANKIVQFSNTCISQQLYPHNIDAYKKYYELFYDYFLDLDDISLSSFDMDLKKRNIDGRYEAFKKEYKKIKGVNI